MENILVADIYFNFFSVFLSVSIVLNSIASLYFGTRLLFLKNFETRNCTLIIMKIIVSFFWMCIFSYIFIMECLGKPIFEFNSFGAVYIRPVILLSIVNTAIAQRICWKQNKILGGSKCQKNTQQ